MAVKVDRCIYTLRIENFDQMKQTIGESRELPEFATSPVSTIEWYARLDYRHRGMNVHLLGKSKREETVKVQFELSILDVDGERHRVLRQEELFREKQSWGEDAYVDFEFVREHPDRLVPDNAMTLRFEIVLYEPGNASEKDATDLSPSGETESDVTLRCGDEDFAVHRSVLSARSSRFEKLFRDPHLAFCCISDTEPGVLKEMIRYAYTGKFSDFPVGLYEAAELYGLSGLTDMVSLKRIYRTIYVDSENCKVVWHVANFDACGDVVLSPDFNAGEDYETHWRLVLRLEEDSVRIHLERISSSNYKKYAEYLVNYNISLEDASGRARYSAAGQCVFAHDGRSCMCADFPKKDVILKEASLFLPNNTLAVCFEMKSSNGYVLYKPEKCEFLFKTCRQSEDTHTIKLFEDKGVQTSDPISQSPNTDI